MQLGICFINDIFVEHLLLSQTLKTHNKVNMKNYRILILLVLIPFFLSCSKRVAVGLDPVSIYAIQSIWKNSICDQNLRGELIQKFLESPDTNFDTSTVIQCFGQPIHKRFFKSKNMLFVYHSLELREDRGIFYGSDLFCILFDKKSIVKSAYMIFIADYENQERVLYYFSPKLQKTSFEGIDDNEYLNIFQEPY